MRSMGVLHDLDRQERESSRVGCTASCRIPSISLYVGVDSGSLGPSLWQQTIFDHDIRCPGVPLLRGVFSMGSNPGLVRHEMH